MADPTEALGSIIGFLLLLAIPIAMIVAGIRRRSSANRNAPQTIANHRQPTHGYPPHTAAPYATPGPGGGYGPAPMAPNTFAPPPGAPPVQGAWPPVQQGVFPAAQQAGWPPAQHSAPAGPGSHSYAAGAMPPSGANMPTYPAPAPPPKRNGGALIVIGVVLLVLMLLGTVVNAAGRIGSGATSSSSAGSGGAQTSETRVAVGECASYQDLAALRLHAGSTSCDDPDALYELAYTGGGDARCPDGERDLSLYTVLTNDSVTNCYIANLRDGACYRVDPADPVSWEPSACSGDDTVRVTYRSESVEPAPPCTSSDNVVTLPSPPRTYCFSA